MKLHSLVPKIYIHISRSDIYIPTIGLLWNLYFSVLSEKELSAQPQERREGHRTAAKQWYPALPFAPAVKPRVHINDINILISNLENYGS